MSKVKIQVINAILTHYTQIGSMMMDPYVTLKINDQQQLSKRIDQGGDMPTWNQYFQFQNVSQADILRLAVYDSDFAYDDLIGQIQIQMKPILMAQKIEQKWYSIKFDNKPAGKIRLSFQVINSKKHNRQAQYQSNLNNIPHHNQQSNYPITRTKSINPQTQFRQVSRTQLSPPIYMNSNISGINHQGPNFRYSGTVNYLDRPQNQIKINKSNLTYQKQLNQNVVSPRMSQTHISKYPQQSQIKRPPIYFTHSSNSSKPVPNNFRRPI